MTPFYIFLRAVVKPLLFLLFPFKTVGLENVPSGGKVILCCNHISMMDIPFLICTCRRQIFFMAKEELFRNPIVKFIFRHMGAFPVARGGGAGKAIEHSSGLLQRGGMLGIFPEGTRSKNGVPGRAKSGVSLIVSKTEAPVVPASVCYKKGKPRLFSRVTIRYGELIPAEQLALKENSSREDLRRVSDRIMATITKQWEQGI